MQEHGGNKGKIGGNRRGPVKGLTGHDLIRDRPPLEDEALALHDIQGNLMEEDPAVGQDEPDGDDGKGQGGIVVFQGKKHVSGPQE